MTAQAATTTAAVHGVNRTGAAPEALAGLGLPPGERLVDAGFATAAPPVGGPTRMASG
jgi:hypothetical protein